MNDSGAARPMIARRMCALALALTLLAGLVGCAPETQSAPGAPGVSFTPQPSATPSPSPTPSPLPGPTPEPLAPALFPSCT